MGSHLAPWSTEASQMRVDGFRTRNPQVCNKNKSIEYKNISFLPDQYEEAVVRLYLHFANFKIETLINRFEQQENKDFSLLQQVEDLKKKKEIYQNTI